MSKYYNPQKSSKYCYNPKSGEPFRLSRSKIDLFLNCPRCFYLDRRLGISQPPGYPFALNSAVDTLLKKEFDYHRRAGTPHPLMVENNIKAVPFDHPQMDTWRDSLRAGITFLHQPTNLLVTGGVDDVWINEQAELIIVDYKSTSKTEEVNLDADWQIGYKRQMEIYQWLFRQNDFKVNPTGYFVYCNGLTDRSAFNARLDFDIKVLPYQGNDSWVEQAIIDAHECLNLSELPGAAFDCDYCRYRQAVQP
ncbi:MAG: PD-(D/E)XK nuclease family protein, partial [Patescibacteria group bacterium]